MNKPFRNFNDFVEQMEELNAQLDSLNCNLDRILSIKAEALIMSLYNAIDKALEKITEEHP